MDHVFDILEKDQRELDAEKWPHLMVLAEKAYDAEVAMTEGMPEPIEVSGLGRTWPGTHVSNEDTNRAQRLRSPREVFTR
ncbi:MAG: hypothetical protein EB168_08350 [Euryarchaeota archaeon]|nr:hypothetical protein [Euryarchaeota archaeon]